MPYRLWQGLCSLKLTLILLFALAGVALVGTVVPQNLAPEAYLRIYPQPVWTLLRAMGVHDLYRAWWFLALPGLLGLNLAACTLQRLPGMWRSVMRPRLRPDPVWLLSLVQHAAWSVPAPQETIDFRLAALLRQHFARPRLLRGDGRNWLFAQKNAWARFSVVVTHLAILLILGGALVGKLAGFRTHLEIAEGATVATLSLPGATEPRPLGFALRCDDFAIDYYPGTDRVREYRTLLTVLEDGRELPGLTRIPLLVNHPLRFRGLNFFQSSYDLAAPRLQLQWRGADQQAWQEVPVVAGEPVRLADGHMVMVTSFSDEHRGQGPAAGIVVVDDAGRHGQAIVGTRRAVSTDGADGLQFRLKAAELNYITVLQVTRDPGVPLVWAGCLLLLAGLAACCGLSHQRVWVLLRPVAGGTEIWLGGRAHRQQRQFADRFAMLRQRLQEGLSQVLAEHQEGTGPHDQ